MSEAFDIEEHKTREDWLEARRQGIGASEAPIILGVSPWSSPLELYAQKLGLIEPSDPTEKMEWGLILEGPVAARYESTTGRRLRERPTGYVVHRSREAPWMTASLDREILEAERPGPAPLELKTTGYYREDEWADRPPDHVLVQVQQQLFVTGWQWASVVVLIGGQTLRWFDVERHEAFIAALRVKVDEFWHRLVHQDPPPADARAKDIIGLLYPYEVPGATIVLPPEAAQWHVSLTEAKAQLAAWGKVRDEQEVRIKAALGEAEIGVIPNVARYTWRSQTRREVVLPATTFRVLRAGKEKIPDE